MISWDSPRSRSRGSPTPGGVHPGQQGGQGAVDQGAVDDPVDLVQPVAEDGDAGRDRDRGDHGQAGDGDQAVHDRPLGDGDDLGDL
jgi:hypothetical protein